MSVWCFLWLEIVIDHCWLADMLRSLWLASTWQSRKRGRGGWRQRQATEDVAEDQEMVSRIVMGHLQDWADGVSSSTAVKRHMEYAVADGVTHHMVERLAKIGSTDGSMQHCHSDLMSIMTQVGIPELITHVTEEGSVDYMVLPSTLIRCLHNHYKHEFQKRLGCDTRKLEPFWKQFFASRARRAWASQHPFLKSRATVDWSHAVPLTVHEDAGPASKLLSANCLSFSGLLGVGDEKVTKFLVCSSIKNKTRTDHNAWPRLLADLDMLGEGIELGGEVWKFVFLFAKADEEQHVVSWGLPSYNAPDEVCSECLADRNHRPFTDLSPGARWRETERMPFATYVQRVREPKHPLVASKFFTRYLVFLDLMHLLDCKGVAAITFGGLLTFLLSLRTLGPNRHARLAAVNAWATSWYDARPGSHRLPRIKESHLRIGGWAELHGPNVKAANTRHAAPLFADLARTYLTEITDRDVAARTVAIKLAELYDVLYAEPIFMSSRAVDRVKHICAEFGTSFMILRDICCRSSELSFSVKPKVHKMQHLPMLCTIINPRFVQCYGEESLIGTTVKVWKKSMSGRYESVVQRNVLTKRLLGLFLRLEP